MLYKRVYIGCILKSNSKQLIAVVYSEAIDYRESFRSAIERTKRSDSSQFLDIRYI